MVIQGLQEELIALRLKDADTDTLIKELKIKIKDLEDVSLDMLCWSGSNYRMGIIL